LPLLTGDRSCNIILNHDWLMKVFCTFTKTMEGHVEETKRGWVLFSFLVVVFGILIFLKYERGEQFILSSIFLLAMGLFGMVVVLYTTSCTEYEYGHLMNIVNILTLAGAIFSALFSLYEIPFENVMQWKSLKVYYVLLIVAFLRATIAEVLLEWKNKYFVGYEG
jgi:hypothetical protein